MITIERLVEDVSACWGWQNSITDWMAKTAEMCCFTGVGLEV
jgi:hypothetical protein